MERQWSQQQERAFRWFSKDKDFFRMLRDDGIINIDVDSHLIVRARAGTGKTTVIIEGVKRAPEKSMLICAFSKIIQTELETRIGKDHPNVKAQTLHSVGYGCVRRFRENIRVEFNSSRADALTEAVCGRTAPDTIKRLVSKLHTKGREIAPHANQEGDLLDIAIRFECEPDEQWAKSGFPLEKVEHFALQAMELAANVQSGATIDGSDMIFLPVRNHWLQCQYGLVVVDECQDLTTAQLEIAQGVLNPGGRICIVGDDRQAIFGFRGADSESLDRLKRELNAGELGLTTTYRCGREIVDLAQQLVPDFEAGEDNSDGDVYSIHSSELVGAAGPGDYILSRVNAPLVSIAMRLLRSGKRTRIAGRDIGKGLITLVRKMRGCSVPDFLQKVASWEDRELSRLRGMRDKAEKGRKATIENKLSDIVDQAEMLVNLAEGAKSITEIEERIEGLFSDDGLGTAGMITCSSIHKAKGLEADRVFILEDTLRNHNIEEINLRYVAITRTKQTLVFVSDRVKD